MALYYNWDDNWTFLDYSSGTDIDGIALNDAASLTSDELTLDGYTGAEIGVATVEDNTGATDGNIEIYVLGYGATGWETRDDNPWLAGVIEQEQNATNYRRFSVSAMDYSSFKVLAYNDCGQQVSISIKYKRSQIASS
jgi:hypothetical protein